MKEDFLKYLGPADSLSGYVRSYKLVFYKCFFGLWEKNKDVSAEQLTQRFQKYYIDRKESGLEPDANVDKVIQNVEQSSPQEVYSLILRDPFAAISGKGYISRITRNGKDYFKLDEKLDNELTSQDVQNILDLVDQKLSLYFSRIDGNDASLRDMVNRIFNDYVGAKAEKFSGNPLGDYFRKDIPQILYHTGIVDSKFYLVKGSVGQGNWAIVPWICIFDRSITTSATEGVYVVYLLSADGKTLYLTLEQGCSELRKMHSKKETIQIMREKAEEVVSKIDSRGFYSDENIDLGSHLTELAELYQKGTIFYKEYKAGQVPSETELRQDLSNMMMIYQDYANSLHEKYPDDPPPRGGEVHLTIKDTIDNIKAYIAAKGFSYEKNTIENFYLSLKSKPFVILAGISGTGKTRLVRLFAEAVGATVANGRYKMVSVRPDWSDSSDLFGHVDLNGNFVPGAIIDFVKRAQEDKGNPYFLCLDEMNLARVEYYMSDFLSTMETRNKLASGEIVSDPLIPLTYYGTDKKSADHYGTLYIPENLYIIGTVNMDETTFPFSRKVLDRANTIEFSNVDLIPGEIESMNEAVEPKAIDNSVFKTEYLLLSQCAEDWETVIEYCAELEDINQILQKAGAHVGYRVRDEIVFYLLNNKKDGLLDENLAFDYELMQKILPRIQGSNMAVKEMLCDLFKLCADDYDGYQTQSDDINSKMMKAVSSHPCRYENSAKKIAFMMRRFEEDGFTSYWL